MRPTRTITHYDYCNLNYSSYFLAGLLEAQEAFGYDFVVSKQTPRELVEACGSPWREKLLYVPLFHVTDDGDHFSFCIDALDSSHVDSDRTPGYCLPLLERVRYYFKMNYDEAEIWRDDRLRQYVGRIHPIKPCYPVRPPRLWPFRPRLRPNTAMSWTTRCARERARILANLPPLSDFLQLRQAPKDCDVYFVVAYWGANHEDANHFRLDVMERLQRAKGVDAVTGFASETPLPARFERYRKPFSGLREHLRRMAGSRVALYVRGMHGCLSFKLSQQLGLGLPVAGQRLENDGAAFYRLPRFDTQYAYEEPASLVARVVELLGHPDERAALGEVNARTFDAHLTPLACMTEALSRMFGPAMVGQEA